MEYKIVYAQDEYLSTAIMRLEEQVIKLQKDGWKCQGGVSISHDGWGHVAQAMIKE